MKRSSLREQIFKILFRMEFNPESDLKEQEELFFGSGDLTVTGEDREYIEGKTRRIMDARQDIDALLTEKMKGWTLDRVGKVELAVLRLAVYEIVYDADVPEGVAISEAVELAKKFGSEKSGAFVNGVLSRFVPKGSGRNASGSRPPEAEETPAQARPGSAQEQSDT